MRERVAARAPASCDGLSGGECKADFEQCYWDHLYRATKRANISDLVQNGRCLAAAKLQIHEELGLPPG